MDSKKFKRITKRIAKKSIANDRKLKLRLVKQAKARARQNLSGDDLKKCYKALEAWVRNTMIIQERIKWMGRNLQNLLMICFFKNYQTTIAISGITYFEVKHGKNYIGFERFIVDVNKDAIQELCGKDKQ